MVHHTIFYICSFKEVYKIKFNYLSTVLQHLLHPVFESCEIDSRSVDDFSGSFWNGFLSVFVIAPSCKVSTFYKHFQSEIIMSGKFFYYFSFFF